MSKGAIVVVAVVGVVVVGAGVALVVSSRSKAKVAAAAAKPSGGFSASSVVSTVQSAIPVVQGIVKLFSD